MALSTARHLTELVEAGNEDLLAARDAYSAVNARLFVEFTKVKEGKRELNKLVGGHITFGTALPPVPIYDGPTSRKKVKKPARKFLADPGGTNDPTSPEPVVTSEEGESLGNQSRGDWRSFEPLVVAYVDTVLSPSPEVVVATRVVRLSA